MAKDSSEGLKALVLASRRDRKGTFEEALRARLMKYAERRWRQGATSREVAEELGMSVATVAYWRARRAGGAAEIQEVRVVTPGGEPEPRRFRLSGPRGTALEDLTLDDVAELWKRLS